ncbi:hypothetical protein SBA1_730023 [Candidatus Sulfotelmatobacter kueseliae]|uniref:Uncharacterized protein n=1 Tax=Candidatus Sulfotelmatobacter kueseliae TaxID=2042962 RepID=A0A2U3L5X1_9BACT|nr:hypothetical protein SBA1_730023 [Candidatus Sulfotelmatobacter kueseliae]
MDAPSLSLRFLQGQGGDFDFRPKETAPLLSPPRGLFLSLLKLTHGLRRGLHSFAASRLPPIPLFDGVKYFSKP